MLSGNFADMKESAPQHIKTITELHRLRGLPDPQHPLISVVNIRDISNPPTVDMPAFTLDFYCISNKRIQKAIFKYGQQYYDFTNGALFFMAPHQVMKMIITEEDLEASGWILLIHPDFLDHSSLASTITQYDFFSYAVNEALFLSDKEEKIIEGILQAIEQEYHSNIDNFSKKIIISHLESLLNYSDRFYHRQFLTREKANHELLDRLNSILTKSFDNDNLIHSGIPTVQSICEQLNISAGYLSRALKILTGQTTQQLIHEKLISKAKEQLSTTNLSVSEVAYALGFEHPQSFNKLFKAKTKQSPLAFKRSFN